MFLSPSTGHDGSTLFDRPRRRLLRLVGVVVFVAGVFCVGCGSPSLEPTTGWVLRGETMGTYYVVKVATAVGEDEERELTELVEASLVEVNDRMSTYIEDSELSRFNRHTEPVPFEVSPELFEVVAAAVEVTGRTGGAYDATIGPLVNAWGFGPGGIGAEEGVGEEELAELRARIGVDKLSLEASGPSLAKAHPELYVDLSGIAKGHAVDRLSRLLRERGHRDHWVEIGGEVRAAGLRDGVEPWRLGIERPTANPGTVQRIVPLSDAAIATSGDYRNYREVGGRRVAHILDPRSGQPISHRLASVSVIAEDCRTADALATALMVMGDEEGWKFALENALPVLLLVREGEGFNERVTMDFERLAGLDIRRGENP